MALTPQILFQILVLLCSFSRLTIARSLFDFHAKAFNVRDYGAVPDGKTDALRAFQKTWEAACRARGHSAVIIVPRGQYLLSPIIFSGPCTSDWIIFKVIEGATLLAPSSYIEGDRWIEFKSLHSLWIEGGRFDGRGKNLWNCKAMNTATCPHGATTLSITNSNNVYVHNPRLIDSERFHMGIHKSTFVTIYGAKINAPKESPNTDGIHVEYSSYVSIYNANIATGDDCVSLSHQSKHIYIDSITCGPGHGVSIGSLGEDPNLIEEVYNVTAKNMIFDKTENGLRIKTWGTDSEGQVQLVSFKNVTMNGVKYPIIVHQDYCDEHADPAKCRKESSKIAISHVNIEQVTGTSTQQNGMILRCSEARPCTDIRLKDIDLKYVDNINRQGEIKAECSNASGLSRGVMHPSCF